MCPNCGGIHADTRIEEAHGVRYICCPLCGEHEFRARFHNPSIDWRLVVPKPRRKQRR